MYFSLSLSISLSLFLSLSVYLFLSISPSLLLWVGVQETLGQASGHITQDVDNLLSYVMQHHQDQMHSIEDSDKQVQHLVDQVFACVCMCMRVFDMNLYTYPYVHLCVYVCQHAYEQLSARIHVYIYPYAHAHNDVFEMFVTAFFPSLSKIEQDTPAGDAWQ